MVDWNGPFTEKAHIQAIVLGRIVGGAHAGSTVSIERSR